MFSHLARASLHAPALVLALASGAALVPPAHAASRRLPASPVIRRALKASGAGTPTIKYHLPTRCAPPKLNGHNRAPHA